jgi:heptosyltransferase-2
LPDKGFGAKHQAQYWLDLVGLLGANTAARPAFIQKKVPNSEYGVPSGKPIVVIHAGSGGYSMARRWDAANFAAVADRLHDEYAAEIVLVGAKGDNSDSVKGLMKTSPTDLTGKTSLPE